MCARPKASQPKSTAATRAGRQDHASRAGRDPGPAGAEGFCSLHAHAILATLIAIHFTLFAAIAVIKYRFYLFRDFDLAIFVQACDQLLHGSIFSSIRGMNWLGDHSSLVLFLITPVYALFRHPLTLVFVQALALAAGAIPASRIARRASDRATFGVAFAVLYLSYPALGYVDLFEFHPEALAVAPLLFALDALERGRVRSVGLWAALAALTREDVALVLAGMAAYALISRGRRAWKPVASLAALAAASIALSFLVLKPWLSSGEADYGRMYSAWGATPGEMIRHLATHPWRALADLLTTAGDPADGALKRAYFVHLLLPLGLLPLASPLLLIAAAPIVFEHMLSSRPAQHSIVFQYAALVIPFVVAAAAHGAAKLAGARGATGRPRAHATTLVIGVAMIASLASNLLFGPVIGFGKYQGIARPEDLWPDAEARTLAPIRDSMLARVPRREGVVAGLELVARLASRGGVHSIHHFLSGHYTYSSKPYPVPRGIGALAADLADGGLFAQVDSLTSARWRELTRENHLRPVASADDNLLFLRNSPDSLELCGPVDAAPERALSVLYDGQLQYLGGDSLVATAPGDVLPIATYWRRAGRIDRFFLTEMMLVDESGDGAYQVWRYLGYTIYPPSDWPAGVTVCERYRMVLPLDLEPGRYELVMRPWGRGAHQAVSQADDPRIRADANWASLGKFEVKARVR